MIEKIIDQVHPDYLQIDCKGHPGLSSYPTKVGNPGPGFCRRSAPGLAPGHRRARRCPLHALLRGVGFRSHPAAIRTGAPINADGKTNGQATSFFGPYADQLLIPQLRELAGDYGVDGVWVDGECWASVPDYGAAALQAFRGMPPASRRAAQTRGPALVRVHGIQPRSVPPLPAPLYRRGEEDQSQLPALQQLGLYRSHARAGQRPRGFSFRRLLARGQRELRAVVGALPGAAGQAVGSDGLELHPQSPARAGSTRKPPSQLQREAAVVLALGGGFQAYFKQKRDGSIYDEQMPVMAEVAKFCRARQSICHRADAGATGGRAVFHRRPITGSAPGCSRASSRA